MVGWNPIAPGKWIDMDGAAWKADQGGCQINLIRALREQTAELIWWRAAAHRNGEGLQGGADQSLAIKHVAWLNKNGRQKDANLLGTILAGGLWPLTRCKEAGMLEDDLCPHCLTYPQTD